MLELISFAFFSYIKCLCLYFRNCENTNNHRRVREVQANTQDCRESQRDNIVWPRIETAEQTEKRDTILWLGYLERKRREAQEIVYDQQNMEGHRRIETELENSVSSCKENGKEIE